MTTKYERMLGCIWGGATADAVDGDITGVTQMTVFTLESMLLMAYHHRRDPVSVYFERGYRRWYLTQSEPAPPGTMRWLFNHPVLWQRRAPDPVSLEALAGREPVAGSNGCGAILRSAPCGLIPVDGFDAFTLGKISAQVTHGHPTGILCAGFFAELIAQIVRHSLPLREALERAAEPLRRDPEHEETLLAVRRAVESAASGTDAAAPLGQGQTAGEALSLALVFGLRYEHDFTGGVSAAAKYGPAAAIAGNLLGAMHGLRAIPRLWRKRLREKKWIDRVAKRLWDFELERLQQMIYDENIASLQTEIADGARVDLCDGLNRPLLHSARSWKMVEFLIRAGADPNGVDCDGETALFQTARSDVAEALIMAGCRVTHLNRANESVLHLTRSAEMAELLLAHGAKLEGAGRNRWTPLHTAASEAVVRVLLAHGADVHARDWFNRTPLHMSRTGEIARLLLLAGADPEALDNDQCRAIDSANDSIRQWEQITEQFPGRFKDVF